MNKLMNEWMRGRMKKIDVLVYKLMNKMIVNQNKLIYKQ